MDINQILAQLDHLFSTHAIESIEPFLLEKINLAKEQSDIASQITLFNEIIGFYRDTSQYEKSIKACEDVLKIFHEEGLQGGVPYATTLLNIANALRAAGSLEASKKYYEEVFSLYEHQMDKNDFRYASLNNNMSLLYQEMGEWDNACVCLEKALAIATQYPQAIIEVATTHTNLAMSLLKMSKVTEAMEHLEKAFAIFEQDEEKDYHYSAALAAMGDAKVLLGELEEAVGYYEKAMEEIQRNIGQTQAYKIMEHNRDMVLEKLGRKTNTQEEQKKGMQLAKEFYEAYGRKMLEEKFKEYLPRIAIGLVGYGSECFGFDDEQSKDHDFGPGFCIWLSKEDFQVIGESMQKEYDELPNSFQGIQRKITEKAGKRVGVFSIEEFYETILSIKGVPVKKEEWLYLKDEQLATATNGVVFEDSLGEFTQIRNGLKKYYPQEVWIEKIAYIATMMSQTGQYNYGRVLERKDKVTAHLILADFMKYTMEMCYLLNQVYAPFYKWMYKGMDSFYELKEIKNLLAKLQECQVGDEKIPEIIRTITQQIAEQLKSYGLILDSSNDYLDAHTDYMRNLKNNEITLEELVETIVKLEWKAFDQVDNETGRADCQDNWETFSMMRKSQFLAWPKELVASYLRDFQQANQKNWNLITEKYGRMMESTDPKGYEQIQDRFPIIEKERIIIIEEIVKMQVSWMEEFAKKYPKIAKNARSIRTQEDSLFNTSYETYLRGELKTYSPETMQLYGRLVVDMAQRGENLAYAIISQTAHLYGYASVEEMEQKIE